MKNYEHIGDRKPLVMAQAGFKKDIRKVFQDAAEQCKHIIMSYAEDDGSITQQNARPMRIAIGKVISNIYTPADNRTALADDGAARSPYANVLNKWLAFATYQAVLAQQKWLKNNIPYDVFAGLARATGRNKLIAESFTSAVWRPPSQWRDERGITLSDRIWRSDIETQKRIEDLLAQGVASETSALKLAKQLESSLVPGGIRVRTNKPYGNDVSYNAMRLARTEITAAFNGAAYVSALSNPFVNGIDIARSTNGDPKCDICPEHATIDMNQMRVAEPYGVDEPIDEGPFHPHCMCCVIPVVNPDIDAVTEDIRASLAATDDSEYPENPADAWSFTESLLGQALMGYLLEWIGEHV